MQKFNLFSLSDSSKTARTPIISGRIRAVSPRNIALNRDGDFERKSMGSFKGFKTPQNDMSDIE